MFDFLMILVDVLLLKDPDLQHCFRHITHKKGNITNLLPFDGIVEPEGGDKPLPLRPPLLRQGGLLRRAQDMRHPRNKVDINRTRLTLNEYKKKEKNRGHGCIKFLAPPP